MTLNGIPMGQAGGKKQGCGLTTVILLLAFACASPESRAAGAGLPDLIRPDPVLTPGAVMTTDPAVFCHMGYSRSVRHTSGRLKRDVYQAYGIDRRGGHYEVDHLVPLALGGADTLQNLWPQPRDTIPWNASAKDRLEWRLTTLVCGRAVLAEQAQRDIAADWVAAYGKYCPNENDCPSYAASRQRVN